MYINDENSFASDSLFFALAARTGLRYQSTWQVVVVSRITSVLSNELALKIHNEAHAQ